MGLHEIGSGDGGYTKFTEGDNALVTLQNLELDDGEYQGQQYYQLAMVFEAVNENDYDEHGRIPAWPSSKLTVTDSDEHTSDLAKMLEKAGVLRDVLEEVLPEGSDPSSVLNGDARWQADTEEENEALGKAVASALKGKVLRVGTKHNASGEYSKVDSIYSLADEDPFSEESGSDDDAESEENVLFSSDGDEGDAAE